MIVIVYPSSPHIRHVHLTCCNPVRPPHIHVAKYASCAQAVCVQGSGEVGHFE